ncbi:MAG: hypothetical protein AAFX86_01510 [Pseudomonadota bacterium]
MKRKSSFFASILIAAMVSTACGRYEIEYLGAEVVDEFTTPDVGRVIWPKLREPEQVVILEFQLISPLLSELEFSNYLLFESYSCNRGREEYLYWSAPLLAEEISISDPNQRTDVLYGVITAQGIRRVADTVSTGAEVCVQFVKKEAFSAHYYSNVIRFPRDEWVGLLDKNGNQQTEFE